MELMSERNQVRTVADRFQRAYRNPALVCWDNTTAGEKQAQLRALDPETATAADVVAIIGNGSWVEPKECGECGAIGWDAVELGNPERASVCVCAKCLKAASRFERLGGGERLREWKARAAWMLTWIAGCALVDAALGLAGAWAMLGGVATWHACEWVYDRVSPNQCS